MSSKAEISAGYPAKESRSLARWALWGVLLFMVVRVGALQSVRVESGPEAGETAAGDRVLVNRFIYGMQIPYTDLRFPELRRPSEGDVVVYRAQDGEERVGRVMAVPRELDGAELRTAKADAGSPEGSEKEGDRLGGDRYLVVEEAKGSAGERAVVGGSDIVGLALLKLTPF